MAGIVTKVLHIITGLSVGGAELMLFRLIQRMDKDKYLNEVISLTDLGDVGKKLEDEGIKVKVLNIGANITTLLAPLRLARWIKETNPHLVQTWMYHADLLGGVAAKILGIPVLWNIRQSSLEKDSCKFTTRMVARISAALSNSIPKYIVSCSEHARLIHEALGYKSKKMIVVPNGFDVQKFHPDAQARMSVMQELDLPKGSIIVGLVARFDDLKDHQTFIKAAGFVAKKFNNVHFVLCGYGIDVANEQLKAWIDAADIGSRSHLLGQRTDIPRLTAAFDVTASASKGEGFSNTIGESMSCAVPCVVTNVGDSALIVGATGIVVAPENPDDLATGLTSLISMDPEQRRQLGGLARQRIIENYSLSTIVQRYETVYEDALH